VCPDVRGRRHDLAAEERLEEARGLALAIGLVVADSFVLPVRDARPNLLFGSGQVDNIAIACEQHEAELVIVDGALTPIQQRNLEDRLKRKVIDRTGLILEIFGERAATAEGRLQVELAHLDYQQSRLVRSWTHLERQRGGFGFLGGPGETQIEADRRMIRQRMGRLRRELEQVWRTRALHRERRGRAPWPVIALVGYTNAGKSTLFNRLTGAEVMAEDLLFATLDPTMRALALPGVEKAILSDTVGFISDLPTQLVAAFRATLEEVIAADVICHVRDMANEAAGPQKTQVLAILEDLGVVGREGESSIPILEVWNKWDALDAERRAELEPLAEADDVIAISALTGEGVEGLLAKLGEMLTGGARFLELAIPVSDGRRLAWLHQHGEVVEWRDVNGSERLIRVRLNAKELGQFESL
jgi:GTP-binding protein HflX